MGPLVPELASGPTGCEAAPRYPRPEGLDRGDRRELESEPSATIVKRGDDRPESRESHTVFQSQPPIIYVRERHSVLHGPLTILLVLWAIALPAFLLLLTGFGPIGWVVGLGAGILLAIPWLAGLVILWFLRHIS